MAEEFFQMASNLLIGALAFKRFTNFLIPHLDNKMENYKCLGEKQSMHNLQLPPHSGPPHAIFRTSSRTLDGSRSSQLRKQHLSFLE